MSALNAPFIRSTEAGLFLQIRLQPGASANRVVGLHGDSLKIQVTAPPVDLGANQALIAFLAKETGLSKSEIELVRGKTSRQKVVLLHGIQQASLPEKIDRFFQAVI